MNAFDLKGKDVPIEGPQFEGIVCSGCERGGIAEGAGLKESGCLVEIMKDGEGLQVLSEVGFNEQSNGAVRTLKTYVQGLGGLGDKKVCEVVEAWE